MMNRNPEYEYKHVDTRDIYVDRLYQRDLNDKRVAQIQKEFNPYIVNAPKVSFRDGKFFVFDGQHTVAVLKARNNGKDLMVECKCFYGLTRIDEADLFVLQNGISRNVHTFAKFRAMFNSGDKDVVGMNNACESVGITLGFDGSKARNKIVALSSLFKCYINMGEEDFKKMLNIIKLSWNGSVDSWCAEIINGMCIFCMTYKDQFNKRNLVDRLSRRSPIEIVRDGKVSNLGGNKRFARMILGVYNDNTKSGRLPDLL